LTDPGRPSQDEDSTLTVVGRRELPPRGRLRLLVVGEGIYATHPLPEDGDLVVGRSDKADVCIEDPHISRKHAVLHIRTPPPRPAAGRSPGSAQPADFVEPRIYLEDLGSSNGVRVREALLERKGTVEILPGDPIDLGSTTLIVQRSLSSTPRPRRLWTHGAFEARLEDECARAERSGAGFALLRLHVEGDASPRSVQEALWQELSSVDVVASYGPDEYEILLCDAVPERATVIASSITQRLARLGAKATLGIACHPRDGIAPEEIVARACAAVRGEGGSDAGPFVVVQDGAMQRLHRLVKRIAVGTISVLLLGETGVGKEVLAETIHNESPRKKKGFLRLNCAALSESLLESELFGHERGAFTGAIQAKPGLLETAQGGTVFLDEVGELALSTQVKLLRVIEERKVFRVGAIKPRTIDVRFIAATNRDLETQVAMGAFRQDLFFRLNGIALVIPPLRERLDEIEGLAKAFILGASQQAGRPRPPQLSLEALTLLRRYGWPGNIRELRNVIERAVLLCGDGPIALEHLPVEKMGTVVGQMGGGTMTMSAPMPPWPGQRPQAPGMFAGVMGPPAMPPTGWNAAARVWGAPAAMEHSPGSKGAPGEREKILEALDRCAGNQTKAAKLLGISRRTLVARLEQYGLPRPRKHNPR
jgi:two-component system, NtrC family, response regulator AtoC